MVISGLLLLFLLWVSPIAASCAGFATMILILLPRLSANPETGSGVGIIAGLPVIVGLCVHPVVFCVAVLATWWLIVGLSQSLTDSDSP